MRLDVICFVTLKSFASLRFQVSEAGRHHIKMHFLVFPAIGFNVLLIYQIRRTGCEVRKVIRLISQTRSSNYFLYGKQSLTVNCFYRWPFFLPLSEKKSTDNVPLSTTGLKKSMIDLKATAAHHCSAVRHSPLTPDSCRDLHLLCFFISLKCTG
jgi:hypothetical protein